MSSDDLQTGLRKRWDELKQAIASREEELERVQEELADLRDQEQACATLLRKQFGEKIALRDLVGVSLREAAAAALADASVGPDGLHVQELTRRMEQRGWQSDAKKPVGSVASCLPRYAEFEKTTPNTYRLRSGEDRDDNRRAEEAEGPGGQPSTTVTQGEIAMR